MIFSKIYSKFINRRGEKQEQGTPANTNVLNTSAGLPSGSKTLLLPTHKRLLCALFCVIISIQPSLILSGCSEENIITETNSTRVVVSQVGDECGTADSSDYGNWNGDTITVEDIRACETIEEYLEVVMPCYQYYCSKYGIKYPGVLALQAKHESGVPTTISNVMEKNNNMCGLKYSSGLPNASEGTDSPSNESGIYASFTSIDKFIEAHVWNIAEGSYYTSAMAATTMEDFTYKLVRVWTSGSEDGDDSYAPNIVEEYETYNLSAYEGNTYTGRATTTTASAVSSTTGEIEGDTNDEKIWNYLKSQGFSDRQAAAVMGNFYQESKFDPAADNGAGYYGLAQWGGGRKTALEDYATSVSSSADDLTTQLEFFIKEFAERERSMSEYLAMTDATIDELTTWFNDYYEVSGDAGELLQLRIDYAYEFYELYAGTAETISSDDACDDVSTGSADAADGAEYHLTQQLSNNCGAAAFTMAVNMILGDPDAYDDKTVFEEMGGDTTTIGWGSDTKAANWLTSKGLTQIEVHEVQSINSREDLIEHLKNGEMCIVSTKGQYFVHNDGSLGNHEGGHYILFYAYRNGEFYVNDSAVSAEQGAAVKYTAEQVDNFFASSTRNGGGSICLSLN